MAAALDIQQIAPAMEARLAALFTAITAAGDDRHFHPHPFDERAAHDIAHYRGRDLYVGASIPGSDALVGYGMLRGWDAGYEVPSLGILVEKHARGRGVSTPLMLFLHDAARARGSAKIRLKVYPDNIAAVKLYRSLGYVFAAEEQGQLVGIVDL